MDGRVMTKKTCVKRATLAEKEVNSLKEKLSTTDRGVSNNNNNISNSVNNNDGNDMDVTAPPPPPSLSAPTLPTSLPLAASTSPTPPTSSSPMIVEQNGIAPPSPSTTPVSESGSIHRPEVALSPSEKPLGGSRSPMTPKGKTKEGFGPEELSSSSARTSVSECHKGSSEKLNNSTETNCSGGETESPKKDPIVDGRTRSLTEELSAKDRER
uniref:Uncharacterized protein n=1 Tax=Anopheles minimus TaxID=112268 RepID=A0A182VW45_9DIPT